MEMHSSIKRIIRAAMLLLITSMIGVVGFRLVEDYGWLDSIYMTAITMSTVGFGTVGELSQAGKLFSTFLIIFSAGTFVYAITTLTTFVVEGEVQHIFNRFQVSKKVAKLSDHIIICGLGRNGREAARELIRQKQPFVIIELDEEVIEEFMEHQDFLAIKGDANHEDVLDRANIEDAKGLISALPTDAENVYVTLTARGMNPNIKIVARASHNSTISKLKRAGANRVIAPSLAGGQKMVNIITRPALIEFVELVSGEGNPDFHLEEIVCSGHPKLLGQTLADLHIRAETGVLVLGYKRGDQTIQLNPPVREELHAEDRIFVIGNDNQLAKFRKKYLE